ncbi:hypothetical protein N7532_001228 [Penicillium argentinense]|uniref:Zn(2)-C6 fungal-type domain-containing protein n=1 Tax=Penicillium argentinense TaxID=1131581 RepID=A0A9W9G265_9EURO|nr:uncharacterized protein N7532_001228 [Penicillium argentinense]KAJ5110693.1 hypothetical protein N7532_001228 [Penicillium argentinense]
MEMETDAGASAGKQPACLNCRRSKIRCNRPPGHARCEKCRQLNAECVVPSHHLGRQKGVKNKRKGLEKAIHQIEQAIKRPKTDSGSGPDDAQKAIAGLQDLLSRFQGQLTNDPETFSSGSDRDRDRETERDGRTRHPLSPREQVTDENLMLDDAENPLQLLARASDLQISPTGVRHLPISSPAPLVAASPPLPQASGSGDVLGQRSAKDFFVPTRASLDVGDELDPVELGLVTFDESESLFSYFYQNLAHTRWGLDPLVHSARFVRAQSAFLFTSIMAAAALFLPSAGALSKRLSRHVKWLAKRAMTHRHRSVEIVLAFMVNVPWMAPGDRLGDDDTCSYIAMALTVALDLSLNKIVTPSSSFDRGLLSRLARADCIDARRALHMDGFDDVDPGSEWGRRLLRRRERTWIALFVVERGVCLARGRSYTVPPTALIENCDYWHRSDIADRRDGPMNSMAILRRDLDDLFRKVKFSCDSYRIVDTGSEAAQTIKKTIESFYANWYATWAMAISEDGAHHLPPYVEILVTHTQLSTYGGVINHPTAPIAVKRFFRAAGLSSALNVLRAAIQGEARLKSMPNNTVIMISFAACSALSLSVTPGDSRSSLAPSVRALIEETAGVLERIGATPDHRNGSSVLYGRFLRELIRRGPNMQMPQTRDPRMDLPEPVLNPTGSTNTATTTTLPAVPPAGTSTSIPDRPPSLSISQQPLPPDLWSEPMQFSAMSDGQIIDAVNRAGSAFGSSIPDVPFDDMLSWDWPDFANTEFSF